MANGEKILTITTVTQENHRFYDVWQQAQPICPICTSHDDISWADLQSDLVELCEKHAVTPDGELTLSGKSK